MEKKNSWKKRFDPVGIIVGASLLKPRHRALALGRVEQVRRANTSEYTSGFEEDTLMLFLH